MKVLRIAEKTYYNWKNQKRPIVAFLEEYFTEKDLVELIESGKIEKLEIIKKFSADELKERLASNKSHVSDETLHLFPELNGRKTQVEQFFEGHPELINNFLRSSRLDGFPSIDKPALKDQLITNLKRFASQSDDMTEILNRLKGRDLHPLEISIVEAKDQLCSILQTKQNDTLANFVNDYISNYEAYLLLACPGEFIAQK